VNPDANPTLRKLTLDRLIDELEQLDRDVRADDELDRQQLRERVELALSLACSLLDGDPGQATA
jgi:hypothetical protein